MTDGREFTYKDSGVDVAAGNEAVRLLKERLQVHQHPLVLEGIGGFGGVMRMPPLKDAVLVAGTDGVGTKIMIAKEMGRLRHGRHRRRGDERQRRLGLRRRAALLPRLPRGRQGRARAGGRASSPASTKAACARSACCSAARPPSIPGHFKDDDDFDMAGFAVGIAERDELWGPARSQPATRSLGIASSGLHSNGFSPGARAAARARASTCGDPFPGDRERPRVGEVLLTPTTIYSPVLHDLGHACDVHAAAHITGGGFPDNVGRALPDDAGGRARPRAPGRPPAVFAWLHEARRAPTTRCSTPSTAASAWSLALPADELPKALATSSRAAGPRGARRRRGRRARRAAPVGALPGELAL